VSTNCLYALKEALLNFIYRLTGIVCAALGADVTMTDQPQILFLSAENSAANRASLGIPESRIRSCVYEWGVNEPALGPPFDVRCAMELASNFSTCMRAARASVGLRVAQTLSNRATRHSAEEPDSATLCRLRCV
jgi:hypothetical protein